MTRRDHGAPREEVTVGVVGTAASVRRMVTVAQRMGTPSLRLVSAAYEKDGDARSKALRIAADVDVVLFSGPLAYDQTMAEGGLPVPAVFVPSGGPALPTVLLRAVLQSQVDLEHVSIDSVTAVEVEEAYAELGLDVRGVHVLEYRDARVSADFVTFHDELYRTQRTEAAITTLPDVAARLSDAQIPTFIMRAEAITLRSAVNTALLVGGGASLENTRMTIIIVRLPAAAVPHRTSRTRSAFLEVTLAMMRELLHEARRMDATVVPRDDTSFLVIATMGSLRAATQDLSFTPFVQRLRSTLGIEPEIGIGYGRTTVEAEAHAEDAVDRTVRAATDIAFMVGPNGAVVQIPRNHGAETPLTAPREEAKEAAVLYRLVDAMTERGQDTRIVQAEQVAELLGVTLRTARRQLRALVHAGLAWPLPPAQTNKAGRPPIRYQLLDHRLHP